MNMKSKKILITGASGFLGGHLVPICEKKGYKVLKPRSRFFNLFSSM